MSQAEIEKRVLELHRLLERDRRQQREIAIKLAAKVAELRACGLSNAQANILERAVAKRVKAFSK